MSYELAWSDSERSLKGWSHMAEMSQAELSQAVRDVVGVLEGLQGSADQLTTEIEAVREESAEVRKTSKRARLWSGVGAVVACLVLLIVSTGFLLARAGENEQAGRDAQTAKVIEVIQACTSPGPGHDCYTENQGRSNQRLAPIVGIICDIGREVGVAPEKLRQLCP